jgi:hypothetical protein
MNRQPVLHDVERWIIARLSVHLVDRLALSVERSVSAAAEGRRLDTVVRIRAASAMQYQPLFNDMIRPQQQWPRDREAEQFGGLQVEDELEMSWLLHG